MSNSIHQGLTLPQAINNSEVGYAKILRASVVNGSRYDNLGNRNRSSQLVRAQLIHLGNVGTRNIITRRNVDIQKSFTQGPRNVMEEKHQKQQNILNQSLSKISSKLTSLFSRKNFLTQGTQQIENSTTVSNATLANQNVYPLTGNVAASTDTNIAISLQAGQLPSQAAINIINISAPELAQQLPSAINQSIQTLSKMGEKFGQRPINASLL